MGVKALSIALIAVWLSGLILQSYGAYPPPRVAAGISAPELKFLGSTFYPDMGDRMITASVTNMGREELQFVAFLEIRDSQGVTIFLQYHTGLIKVEGRSEIASSWQAPDLQAKYELRAFVISNFTKPQILTDVSIRHIANIQT